LENIVSIYADGACRGNPGPGGWGAFISADGKDIELCGGERHTTNNQMELTAVIRAIETLVSPSVVQIHTDSQYVQKGISEWIHGWKRKGWRTAAGSPVKNVELWKQLDELAQKHQIEWKWVRGHNGNVGNERADKLANRGIDELK